MMDNNNREIISGGTASQELNDLGVAEDGDSVLLLPPEGSDLPVDISASSVVADEDVDTNFRGLPVDLARPQQEEPYILEFDEDIDHIMDLARYLHNAHIDPKQLSFGDGRGGLARAMQSDIISDDEDEPDRDENDGNDGTHQSISLYFPKGNEFFVHWLENETTQQWISRQDNDDSDNESISAHSNDSLKYYHRKKKSSSSDDKCSDPSNTSSSKSV